METPPNSPTPPPQYVQYPRGLQGGYGTAQDLRNLKKAYYGCQWMIAVTLGSAAMMYTLIFMLASSSRQVSLLAPLLQLAFLGLMVIVNAFIAYKHLSLLALVNGQGSGYVMGYTVLAAMLSPCCFGVLGPVVIQSLCGTELGKFGLKAGPFVALKKRQIDDLIRQYEEREAMQAPATPPTT